VESRELDIDGNKVVFAIEASGQAMSLPPPGKADVARPTLTATVLRGGKRIWSGRLSTDVTSEPLAKQFTDEDLRRAYRAAGPREPLP
jgi:hypothetical protein